jgi:hypothetical protein
MALGGALLVGGACAETGPHVTRAASTVYVRQDTDATRIISPSVDVSGQSGDVTAQAGFAIDAWTGASIDVISAATKAIHEVRQEATTGLGYDHGELRLSASYRFSHEPDYVSHGVKLGVEHDFARKNTTVGVDLLASDDTVGRSGDPGFAQPLRTLGGRASITQVLGTETLAQLAWETTVLDGYLASPYRFVPIGGAGTCASGAIYCVPELVPSDRVRSALFARGRRALSDEVSLGLEYRFYFDSWGVMSHALQPDLGWHMSDEDQLDVRVRYYTQGDADFYRPRYATFMAGGGYLSRDRKLSAFYSGEVGLEYAHRFALDDNETVIVVGARGATSAYDYLDYVGLSSVWAFELTGLFAIERP